MAETNAVVVPERPSSRALQAVSFAVPWLLFLGLCGVAFYHGRQTCLQTEWPYFHDAWRDIGIAQSMLDGRYPEDHLLTGEIQWYNPLVASLVAAVSGLTGLPPHLVDARLGAYVNLTLPVFFFLLGAALFGRWAALAAATVFVLGRPLTGDWEVDLEVWRYTITYSPWLWPPTFSQGLFFLTLALYWKASQRARAGLYVCTGASWGLTFLCHTGPAVILGCIFVLMTALETWDARRERPIRPHAKRVSKVFLLPTATAFCVSLPYTLPILWRYQFRMADRIPSYVSSFLELSHLPEFLLKCLTPSNALAVAGLVILLAAGKPGLERRLFLSWLVVVVAFVVQFYLSQYLDRWHAGLPQIVPAHHFIINLTAAKMLLIGYAMAAVGQAGLRCGKWVGQGFRKPFPNAALGGGWDQVVAGLGATGILCAALLPTYGARDQFVLMPDFGWHTTSYADRIAAYDWILTHCAPSDVFLCDEQLAARIVGPAGRKIVTTIKIFSNPYVDYDQRFNDKFVMYEALERKDEAWFRKIAGKYHVKFILVKEKAASSETGVYALTVERMEELDLPFLTRVYRADTLAIYRLEPCRSLRNSGVQDNSWASDDGGYGGYGSGPVDATRQCTVS